jgi:hypothetical protein
MSRRADAAPFPHVGPAQQADGASRLRCTPQLNTSHQQMAAGRLWGAMNKTAWLFRCQMICAVPVLLLMTQEQVAAAEHQADAFSAAAGPLRVTTATDAPCGQNSLQKVGDANRCTSHFKEDGRFSECRKLLSVQQHVVASRMWARGLRNSTNQVVGSSNLSGRDAPEHRGQPAMECRGCRRGVAPAASL